MQNTLTQSEREAKLAELDRLLNNPDVPMDPHRVWILLAELKSASRPERQPRPSDPRAP